jgi:hypothetical protein
VANHRRCHCRGCCSFTASLAKDRLVIGKKLKINWLLGRIDKEGKSSAAVTFQSGFEEAFGFFCQQLHKGFCHVATPHKPKPRAKD